jgi:DNA-binding NarL/FixJ family response regulator
MTAVEPDLTLLLIEPHFMLRRTVISVVRELRLARMREATSVAAGEKLLEDGRPQHGLMLSLEEEAAAMDLLVRVRDGRYDCGPGVPVVVTTAVCDSALALRLRELRVDRVLIKPFRVRDAIDSVAGMCNRARRPAAAVVAAAA